MEDESALSQRDQLMDDILSIVHEVSRGDVPMTPSQPHSYTPMSEDDEGKAPDNPSPKTRRQKTAAKRRKKDNDDPPSVRLPVVETGNPRGRITTVQDLKESIDENTRVMREFFTFMRQFREDVISRLDRYHTTQATWEARMGVAEQRILSLQGARCEEAVQTARGPPLTQDQHTTTPHLPAPSDGGNGWGGFSLF